MTTPMRSRLLASVVALLATAPPALDQSDIPRPEFPDPQFERTTWQSLNGSWQFAFDDADAGLDAHWYFAGHTFDRTITVPYCFESRLSGIGDTSFHRWVWYRREITLPDSWQTRRTLLHFGAVDYQAKVWVNGQLAGSHEGGNTPFSFDITPLLQSKTNSIVVRAFDPPEDNLIPRGKQFWEPKSKGIFYTRTSGIWQPVWLESTGAAYIDNLQIKPDPLGSVDFETVSAHAQEGDELRVSIFDGETGIASGTALPLDLM